MKIETKYSRGDKVFITNSAFHTIRATCGLCKTVRATESMTAYEPLAAEITHVSWSDAGARPFSSYGVQAEETLEKSINHGQVVSKGSRDEESIFDTLEAAQARCDVLNGVADEPGDEG